MMFTIRTGLFLAVQVLRKPCLIADVFAKSSEMNRSAVGEI